MCMFLDIRLMEQKPISFDEILPPGAIRFDSEFSQAGPILAAGTAAFQEATEEIRVAGTLSVSLSFQCDRCTEPFTEQIQTGFDLIYQPVPTHTPGQEISIKSSESDLGFYEGQGLELNEVIEEQVLLAVPLQRLCRADCRGLCPVCGQNKNEFLCDCPAQRSDERWAALKAIH